MHALLSGGDRRSIAGSKRVRAMIESQPRLVGLLAELTSDEDSMVVMRAVDLLEKLAHDHQDWVEPHKRLFIGPLADGDRWEVRLQIVRALPLFHWTPAQMRRVEAILIGNLSHPQTFVRAWALDSLARIAEGRPPIRRIVARELAAFETSTSKALQARARCIRERM